MLPTKASVQITPLKVIPTKTYRFDFETKRIYREINGLDAMVQAMRKIFQTERFAWKIYTRNYGIELDTLWGQQQSFVMAVLESRIREAVFFDDRVIELKDFQAELTERNSITVSCKILTTHGLIDMREELI